jgi:putative addiction module killer protein
MIVHVYQTAQGKEPFVEWLKTLRNSEAKNRILQRLKRLEQGNAGDCKAVGDGVHELRLHFGAGYRAVLKTSFLGRLALSSLASEAARTLMYAYVSSASLS